MSYIEWMKKNSHRILKTMVKDNVSVQILIYGNNTYHLYTFVTYEQEDGIQNARGWLSPEEAEKASVLMAQAASFADGFKRYRAEKQVKEAYNRYKEGTKQLNLFEKQYQRDLLDDSIPDGVVIN